MSKVKNGDTVSVNYTGKLEDGTVFDSSLFEGRTPLNATLGKGQLIKGFEDGLIDMSIGEKKTIQIDPDNAYGSVREEMIIQVPKTNVPQDVTLGAMLQAQTEQGPLNVKVVDVNEETVTLDGNHPLAGKTLIFELELVSID